MKAPRATVRTVLRGGVQPLGRTESAIDKRPVTGAVPVHALGIEGDAQANRRVHGGADKALHCYAWHHHAAWRAELPGVRLVGCAGCLWRELSIDGLNEHGVCIGDRWCIGTAITVVTKGRQPCFKLNLRFGVPDMAARVQNTLRAGWYLRVEQTGEVAAGDCLTLLDRPHPAFTVAHLLALIRDRVTDPAQIEPVLQLPLPPSWHRLFEQRLRAQRVEDWSRRMQSVSVRRTHLEHGGSGDNDAVQLTNGWTRWKPKRVASAGATAWS